MQIFIGSDHRGFILKRELIPLLSGHNYTVNDQGTTSEYVKVDYPDYAIKVAKAVVSNKNSFGILICNTGIGMSIAANRIKGARAALCHSKESAKLARQHNDANILVLGAKGLTTYKAITIAHTFLDTKFEGDRHLKRVEKFDLY